MDHCVNCNIATGRCNTLGRRDLNDEVTLTVIRQWQAPKNVNRNDHICQACWNLAQEVVLCETKHTEVTRKLGHSSVCLRCGRSLASQRVTHQLCTDTERNLRIYNAIREWVMPRTVEVTSRICHACWIAADRASVFTANTT